MSILRDHIDEIVDALLEDAEDPETIIEMLLDSVHVAAQSRGFGDLDD